MKENHPEEFEKAINGTGPKQNILNKVFRHMGIKVKDYEHGFKRGVFFANMYDNGLEYVHIPSKSDMVSIGFIGTVQQFCYYLLIFIVLQAIFYGK